MGRVTTLDLVLGLFRLALGVFALVWMIVLPGEMPLISPVTFWIIVAVFVIYALLVAGLAQQRPAIVDTVYAASAFIDLAFVTLLVRLSGGQESFFCVTYVFLTAIHTFYFGMGFGLVVGASSSTLCLLAMLWDMEGPLSPIRASFLLTLPILTAFCAGVTRARRETLIGVENALDDENSETALTAVRRILALHVLTRGGGPLARRLDLLDGLLEAVMPAMGLTAYACLLADGNGTSFRCIAQHGKVVDPGPEFAAPGGDTAGAIGCAAPTVHRAHEGVGSELFEFADEEAGRWVCVPISVGAETIGALLAASESTVAPAVLEVLAAAADLVAIDIDQS